MSPLRQFKGVPPDIIRRAEAKQFVSSSATLWSHPIDLPILAVESLFRPGKDSWACSGLRLWSLQKPQEIGELLNLQNAGKLVHRLVHNFPKLQ